MSTHLTAPTGADLLGRYRPGVDTLLAGRARTLLAEGVHLRVEPDEVVAALAETGDGRMVVGALPFVPTGRLHLVVPEYLRVAGPLQMWSGQAAARGHIEQQPQPDPERYAAAVAAAVEDLRAGRLRKVVLARALCLRGAAVPDVPTLVRRLAARDPWSHLFAVALPERGAGARTLVGASPELLVRRCGREVYSQPLAGSAPRHPDPVEDGRRAAALLTSGKDRDEHAHVVAAIVEALTPLCDRVEAPPGPELMRTGAMWHLATRIRARLADPTIRSLQVARALHPTPAVCGSPRTEALEVIERLEGSARDFYAGAVGWEDAGGDGEWAVAIRCAEHEGGDLRLWAGAGIVAQSDPRSELHETAAKLRTLAAAVGALEEGQ